MTVNRLPSSKSTFERFIASVGQLVLPPACCLCDAPGGYDLRGMARDLCAICVEMLPINRYPCRHCATPLRLPHLLCGQCALDPPSFDCALAPYLYMYPVDHLVRGLKFRGERAYGRILGQLLAAAHARAGGEKPDVLVPVPLHAARYRERGFNQAQEIAKAAGRNLGIALASDALVRTTATAEQSALPLSERRSNVRGAFEVRELPCALRVVLVDDVLTTGSTAAEAARMLKEAGVPHVEVWAAARVTLGVSPPGTRTP